MSQSNEMTKLAEDLAGRQLAAAVVGPSTEDSPILELGRTQLKLAFSLDDTTKEIRNWWDRQSEDVKGGLRGAGIGAGLGMAAGAVTSRRHPLRDALMGGLLGGGLGGTMGYTIGATERVKDDKQRDANIAAGALNRGNSDNLLGLPKDLATEAVTGKGVVGRSMRGAAAGIGVNAGIGALFPGKDVSRWEGIGQSLKSPARLGLFGGVGGMLGGLTGSIGSSGGLTEKAVLADYAKIAPVLPPDLRQQGDDLIDRMSKAIIDPDTVGQAIVKLHGVATQRKGSAHEKKAEGEDRGNLAQRYWDDIRSSGQNALTQIQNYEKTQGLPGVLLGGGIGALAGGVLGLSNRRNRFRGMLAGLLGGGLAGAGVGHLINDRVEQLKSPDKPDASASTDTSGVGVTPPVSTGAQHSAHRNFFVFPGAAAGATAGAAVGPRVVRHIGSAPDREVARTERSLQTLRGVASIPPAAMTPEQRLGVELFGAAPPKAEMNADDLKRINNTEEVKRLESRLLSKKLDQARPATKLMQSPRFSRISGGLLGGGLGGGLGGWLGGLAGEYDYARKHQLEQVK